MEKRSFGLDGLEIRKGENATTVRGYAAMFGRMSQPMGGFREVIAPGAFAGSLGEDIRALWQHDSKQVLAVVLIIIVGKSLAAFLLVLALRYPLNTALMASV